MQRAHHLPELAGPAAAHLVRVRGVGALRRRVVQRVVAPVEGVPVRDGGDGGLLGLRCRPSVGGDVGDELLGAVLRDGGDVEGGQQVNGVDACLGQLGEVLHTRGVLARECLVGATLGFRHRLVGAGEVPDVQLPDGARRIVANRRGRHVTPLLRCQLRVIEVDEDGARGVQCQAQRVGVGHVVGDHLVKGAHVDVDGPQVLGVLPRGLAGDRPRTVIGPRGVGNHGVARPVGGPALEGDVLGRGRPHAQRRLPGIPDGAEVRVLHGLAVEGVEHGSDLHGRGRPQGFPVGGADHHLTGQDVGRLRSIRRRECQRHVALQVGVLGQQVPGQVTAKCQGQRLPTVDRLTDDHTAGGVVVEGPCHGRQVALDQRLRPRDRGGGEPLRPCLPHASQRRVGDVDGEFVGGLIVDDLH